MAVAVEVTDAADEAPEVLAVVPVEVAEATEEVSVELSALPDEVAVPEGDEAAPVDTAEELGTRETPFTDTAGSVASVEVAAADDAVAVTVPESFVPEEPGVAVSAALSLVPDEPGVAVTAELSPVDAGTADAAAALTLDGEDAAGDTVAVAVSVALSMAEADETGTPDATEAGVATVAGDTTAGGLEPSVGVVAAGGAEPLAATETEHCLTSTT